MGVKQRFSLAGAMLLMLIAFHSTADAQVLYGSIVGNVNDPSHAPIPGATVTITQRETGQVRQGTTNETGAFSFPTVASGTYDVKVTKEGFQTAASNVIVTINSVSRADIDMHVGQLSETISVSAAAAELQTDRAEVRTEVNTKTLRDLPVPPGRNYQQLFRTVPGFTPPANAHSVPSNPSRSLLYNVNGTSASSNDVRVDGASQFNVWLPHVTAYTPALESIETVNVVTKISMPSRGWPAAPPSAFRSRAVRTNITGPLSNITTTTTPKRAPSSCPLTKASPSGWRTSLGVLLEDPSSTTSCSSSAAMRVPSTGRMHFAC
jgi:Cna protein B-type domain./TonB-dependent Receptor Plug Domain.